MFHTLPYILSTQAEQNLRGTAGYNYIMKPSATGSLILQATVTELHQFSPFNEMSGAAQMEAKYEVRYVIPKKNKKMCWTFQQIHLKKSLLSSNCLFTDNY